MWKIIFVIIGTTIGAGFASGQEIQMFFNYYGEKGLIGMIVSCILTGIIIRKTFEVVKKYNVKSYSDFLDLLSHNQKLNRIVKIIIQLFLLISFYIMIAGFCAYFKQEWNICNFITASIVASLSYATFHKNIQGVISINNVLIPLLIVFVLFLGIKNIPFTVAHFGVKIENSFSFHWLISSILYASYNSILLIPMIIELGNCIEEKTKIKKISFFSTIILTVLGTCLFCLLLRVTGYGKELELPMLQVVKEFGKTYPIFYGFIIVAAIFTSTISAGYSFLKNLNKDEKKYSKIAKLMCIFAVIIAPIGFSNLINIGYPIFGALGLIQIFLLFRKSIEKEIKN